MDSQALEYTFTTAAVAKLINAAFTQPLEYLKVSKQLGYTSSNSTGFTCSHFQARLLKHYSSIYQHQPEAIFKGFSMTMAQQMLFALNLFKMYPLLTEHYASVNQDRGDSSFYAAELYAAGTAGFIHGLLTTPLEVIKMRQISNTLMKNVSGDLKLPSEQPYVVREFLFNPVLNPAPKSKPKELSELKRVSALIKTIPKEKVLTYRQFEALMGMKTTTDMTVVEQMKANKALADRVFIKPATKVVDSVKEMMITCPSVLRNFTNCAFITALQTSVQTTSLVYSLHMMDQVSHYAYTTRSDSYYAQFVKSFILARQNDKFFSDLAPIFIGVPSAFITCILTQPLDNIKSVLQSGQFAKFRQLSDSKQLTLAKNNVAEVLVRFYFANNNIKGLFSGFNLRFIRLSFLQTGFGYGVTKEIGDVWLKLKVARRLEA
ncbi:hypothetical protein QEN19_000930 [Hanseniaspora menglaensis]